MVQFLLVSNPAVPQATITEELRIRKAILYSIRVQSGGAANSNVYCYLAPARTLKTATQLGAKGLALNCASGLDTYRFSRGVMLEDYILFFYNSNGAASNLVTVVLEIEMLEKVK